MKVINSIKEISINESVCLALGNFDGIHKGHAQLLEKCVELARKEGFRSAVFTFNDLTLNAVKGKMSVKRVLSLKEKERLLEELGVDYLITVPFDGEIMKKTPEEFLKLLEDSLDLKYIVCGFDYRFGFKAAGNTELLAMESGKAGFTLEVIPEYTVEGTTASSTLLRKLVRTAEFEEFKMFTERSYYISSDSLTLETSARNSADFKVDPAIEVPEEGLYPCTIVSGKNRETATAMITHAENGAILSVGARDPLVIEILLGYVGTSDFRVEFMN